tara:strand:+ start:1716 stop:2030 length:315 start_codon:yes stop_codon:yes gene_type:complete
MPFSSGKHAYFISDRSGMRFPYKQRVKEWNGSVVHISEFEGKHEQLEPSRKVLDGQGLKEARPETKEDFFAFVVYTNTGLGIIGTKLSTFEATSSLGNVTVSTT